VTNPNKAKTPAPKFIGVGHVLLPGQPGYDEALARIKARKAEQEKTKETKK
jgi:hypothetical protein